MAVARLAKLSGAGASGSKRAPPAPRRAKIRITAASGSSLIATVRIDMPARRARAERVDRGEQDDARDRGRNARSPGPAKAGLTQDKAEAPAIATAACAVQLETQKAQATRKAAVRPNCRSILAWIPSPPSLERRASAKAMHKAPPLLSTHAGDRVGAERRERDGQHEDAGADHRPDDQRAGHPDADPLVGCAPHGGGVPRNARRGNRAGRWAGLARGALETSSSRKPSPSMGRSSREPSPSRGRVGRGFRAFETALGRRTPSPDPSPQGGG